MTQELIQSHLAKARDKLRVARELRERGDSDDAVSRAYYAAFHAAQAACSPRASAPRRTAGWSCCSVCCSWKPGKLDRRWGKFLANLKDDRETGDYDPLSYIDEATAQRAVAEAEGFVEAIERYVTSLQA